MGESHSKALSILSSQRIYIDEVRRAYLVDDEMPEHLRDGARNLHTQLNNALRLLSEDLYSKRSHFILELVQNADDNEYRAGVTPELTLRISSNKLILQNNESGFTEENISAICKVGASSKTKAKQSYIGEKGIGFKSVFSVSNAPEIHSNGYHFRFDRTNPENLLGYVIPTWCTPPTDYRPDYTTIILPAAPDYTFDESTVAELDARVLLFLNKLQHLTLEFPGRRLQYRRRDDERYCHLSTETGPDSGTTHLERMQYILASREYPMTGQYEDQKRSGVSISRVVLAFPLATNGAAKPEPAAHIFAFLPVQQVGFNFPIHADFILSSGRETILHDRPWNIRLRDAIADTFISALPRFRETEALGFSYLQFVPNESDVADDFFSEVRLRLIALLSKEDSLASASGPWRKPSDLRSADKTFRDLFPSTLALELFGFDYVDTRVRGANDLMHELGVTEAGPADVIEIFKSHGTWLSSQPLEWRAKLYAYIASNLPAFVREGLLKVPSLPTESGKLVIPNSAPVFFPLGNRGYGFEAELVILDGALFSVLAIT